MSLTNIIVRPGQLPPNVRADLEEIEESLNALGKDIDALHPYDAHRGLYAKRHAKWVSQYQETLDKLQGGLRFKPSEGAIALESSEHWDRIEQAFQRVQSLLEDVYEGN